jgi:hypothetical protein
MRQEITTYYRVGKADKYHKHHKIQKDNIIFLLTNCLTHLHSTFLPTLFGCIQVLLNFSSISRFVRITGLVCDVSGRILSYCSPLGNDTV